MIKNILYVGFKNEYGIKSNGYAINYMGWNKGLESLGYNVESIFYDDYSKSDLQAFILKKSIETQPDIVFFILQRNQVEIKTLEKLKKIGVFTVNYFGDDQWRFDNYSRHYAPYFSACITTDKYSLNNYNTLGIKNIIHSQWAALDFNIDINNVLYKYDVSFVGAGNRYRKWFVNELMKRNIKIACFGDGWRNGRVTYREMADVFNSSRINLNLSNSRSYDCRYISSSLDALLSTLKSYMKKSPKIANQIKARNFEIPAYGGFQITNYVPSIEDYFDIGREIVCYTDIDEAEMLINYYLGHDDERENIRLKGIENARNNHTYLVRINEIMKQLERMKKQHAV